MVLRSFLRAAIASVLLFGCLGARARMDSDSVPTAVMSCKASPDKSFEYVCDVTAQCPQVGCPHYQWTVSAGKIIGTLTSPNIRIDTRQIIPESLKVMCTVKWPKPFRAAILTKTIKVR
jgi:hypothetical protein